MISFFNKSNSKNKTCEFCGEASKHYFYRFVAEVQYLIFLRNKNIAYNNTTERFVLLTNGSKIDYSVQTDPHHAQNFKELVPHIFCSESCEDRFLKKYVQYFSNDIHNKHILIDYEKEQLFAPVSFPVESFKHNKNKCKYCDCVFPNFNKHYKTSDIVNFNKISGSMAKETLLKDAPKLSPHEIMISDINDNNKEGCYFIYKIGMNGENNLFCSNDCSFDYCLKTNSISIVKSNIEKGYSLAISPHLQEINKALGSVYKFKPVKYQTFGKN